MGFGETSDDFGNIEVVDLRKYDSYGNDCRSQVVAFLDLPFPVDGCSWKLESELNTVVDRVAGIEGIYVSVNADIRAGLINKPGDERQANAKILFDGSVKGTRRAAKCLDLALSAINEHISGLDADELQKLLGDYRKEVDKQLKQELDQGRRGQLAAD